MIHSGSDLSRSEHLTCCHRTVSSDANDVPESSSENCSEVLQSGSLVSTASDPPTAGATPQSTIFTFVSSTLLELGDASLDGVSGRKTVIVPSAGASTHQSSLHLSLPDDPCVWSFVSTATDSSTSGSTPQSTTSTVVSSPLLKLADVSLSGESGRKTVIIPSVGASIDSSSLFPSPSDSSLPTPPCMLWDFNESTTSSCNASPPSTLHNCRIIDVRIADDGEFSNGRITSCTDIIARSVALRNKPLVRAIWRSNNGSMDKGS